MQAEINLAEGSVAERIALVQERIAEAARRSGRSSRDILLVAVSKGHEAELVAEAYAAGLRVFGENRVEEAMAKIAAVPALLRGGSADAPAAPPEWHMIGHIQSRKAAQVVSWASMAHSVDSVKLAHRLSQFCVEAGKELPVLLEVNIAREESKYGFSPDEVLEATAAIAGLPGLRLEGLMTVAPIAPEPETLRPLFAGLRALRDDLAHRQRAVDWRHLSMGMTDDFEVAIEEGATIVRVGRAIFGERACPI